MRKYAKHGKHVYPSICVLVSEISSSILDKVNTFPNKHTETINILIYKHDYTEKILNLLAVEERLE